MQSNLNLEIYDNTSIETWEAEKEDLHTLIIQQDYQYTQAYERKERFGREIARLTNKINIPENSQLEKNRLVKEKEKIEMLIQEDEKARKQAELLSQEYTSMLADVNKKIEAAKGFLRKLNNNAEDLCRVYAENLQNAFANFVKKYPHHDWKARVCLDKVNDKIKNIISMPYTIEGNSHDTNGNYIVKFALLCAFTWDMQASYKKLTEMDGETDEVFANLLEHLLREFHLSPEMDALGRLKMNYTIGGLFEGYKLYLPEAGFMQRDVMNAALKADYVNAVSLLQEQMGNEDSVMQQQMQTLIDTLQNQVAKEEKAKNPHPNYALYAKILHSTCNHDFSRLAFIKNKIGGHPSISLKVSAAICGVLGAALMTAGILAVVGTMGASSVLSAYSMALGASMVLKAGMIVAGVASVSTGIGLFAMSQRHGISKQTQNIETNLRAQATMHR